MRIPLGTADLMLAADLAVAAGAGRAGTQCARIAAVIGNLDLAATAEFKHDAGLSIDAALHRRTIETGDRRRCVDVPARRASGRAAVRQRAGDEHAAAWAGVAARPGAGRRGRAILRAIELNGAAVAMNRRAFLWGRILAERPDLIDEILVARDRDDRRPRWMR